jgi:hypothetical protein
MEVIAFLTLIGVCRVPEYDSTAIVVAERSAGFGRKFF